MVSRQPKVRALLATGLALALFVALAVLVSSRFDAAPQQRAVPPGTAAATTGTPSTPGPVPSVPTPTELPGPAQRTEWVPVETTRQVTYLVTTNGPVEVVHGSIGGDQTTVDVTGDWRLDVELPGGDSTVRVWVTGTGAAELACEILIDGQSVVSRSGYGTPPVAICAANLEVSG